MLLFLFCLISVAPAVCFLACFFPPLYILPPLHWQCIYRKSIKVHSSDYHHISVFSKWASVSKSLMYIILFSLNLLSLPHAFIYFSIPILLRILWRAHALPGMGSVSPTKWRLNKRPSNVGRQMLINILKKKKISKFSSNNICRQLLNLAYSGIRPTNLVLPVMPYSLEL